MPRPRTPPPTRQRCKRLNPSHLQRHLRLSWARAVHLSSARRAHRQRLAMENLEDSEHHSAEEVIYESDDVHVVFDSFAGEAQAPDSLGAAHKLGPSN